MKDLVGIRRKYLKIEKAPTILIADDIRDILKKYLEKGGYDIVTSDNSEEAVKALKEYNISLAIVDLKMSNVHRFLDFVIKQRSFIPVIILTDYIDVQRAVEVMKNGGFKVLTKPIKETQLFYAIESTLRDMDDSDATKPFESDGNG